MKLLPVEKRSCTTALAAISLAAFCRTWLMGNEELPVQPEVSDQGAEPLGIDVRVTRRCCQALVPKKRLHVTQVGSALVEEERRGRMPKWMSGDDRHPSACSSKLDPGVECLIAKGSAVAAGKGEWRSRKIYSPHPAAARLSRFRGKRTIPRARWPLLL